MYKSVVIENIDQLAKIAASIAQLVERGDVITLQGDLGAGKTEWARAFVRYFLGQDQQVPSPTFSLVQTYQTSHLSIWHFDLYRIECSYDVWELGLEEALAEGVSLIEWPERLGNINFGPRLAIKISIDIATQHRIMTFNPDSIWCERLAKII